MAQQVRPNPLANRFGTKPSAPSVTPRPRTAQEAIDEMIRKRQGEPAANMLLNDAPAKPVASQFARPIAEQENIQFPPSQQEAQNNLVFTASARPDGTPIPQSAMPPPYDPEKPLVWDKPKSSPGGVVGGAAANYGINSAIDNALGSAPAATAASSAAPAVASSAPSAASAATPALIPPWQAASGISAPGGAPSLTEAVLQGGDVATAATPAAAGNTFGVLGGALPVAGLAGMAVLAGQQGLDAWKKMQDAKTSSAGTIKAAMMTNPMTAWAAPLVDYLGITSGKHPDQYRRDAVRDYLKEIGAVGDDYMLELADGAGAYDIGKDGSDARYNLDFNKEGVGDLVGLAQGLAAALTGGDQKLTSDFTGYLVNAAMSGGDPVANLRHFAEKMKLDHDTAYGLVHQLAQPGAEGESAKLSKELSDAYKNGLDQLFGVGAYGSGEAAPSGKKKSSGGGGGKKPKDEAPGPVTPVAPTPPPSPPVDSPTAPVSVQDYVDAIMAVQAANQTDESKKKKSNPLMRSLV